MESEEDEYSHLNYEALDGDYSPTPASRSKKRPRRQGKSNNVWEEKEYRIQNALNPPRATTYTAQALFEQIHLGNRLDARATDVVWTAQKQIQLIDSMFRNYYIPPIIFSVTVHTDGSEARTCIDGKQRLTSIRLFMDGLIPHKDPHTSQQLWYRDIPGASKGGNKILLPEKYRQIFANKQVVCVEYGEVSPSDERDIFRRVQLGMALTPAEKLQANSTPRANFVRELVNTYCTESSLGTRQVSWHRERAGDFYVFATAACCLAKWSDRSGLGHLPSMPIVETWMKEKVSRAKGRISGAQQNGRKAIQKASSGQNEDEDASGGFVEVPGAFRARVEKALGVLGTLMNDKRYNTPFRPSSGIAVKVAPLEVVGSIMLVYVTCTAPTSTTSIFSTPPGLDPQCPDDLRRLSHLIAQMRRRLRDIYSEIRMNSPTARPMFDFILEAGRDPFNYEGPTPGTDPECEEEEETWKSRETKQTKRRRRASTSSDVPFQAAKRTAIKRCVVVSSPEPDRSDVEPEEPAAASPIECPPPPLPETGEAQIAVEGQPEPQAASLHLAPQQLPPVDIHMLSQHAMYTQMLAQSMMMMGMPIPPSSLTALTPMGTNISPHMIPQLMNTIGSGGSQSFGPVPEGSSSSTSDRFSRMPTEELGGHEAGVGYE
uniref:GmrSD restriction endonucleases N-terminal domain-containing protein n=1 Tax=Moniliophthora roreri TaxID=221103 RepID=A0A0W0GDG2_MONRR